MFTLTKEFKFEASHQLPNHDGKCQRLHGHSWVGRVVLKGSKLAEDGPKQGMLIDFGDVSKVIKPTVDDFLDHHHLNDTLNLKNPTSEEVARLLYQIWKPLLPMLYAVEINETCTSSCCYDEEVKSLMPGI